MEDIQRDKMRYKHSDNQAKREYIGSQKQRHRQGVDIDKWQELRVK